MNIAFVASEVVPFSKTGGLADVSGVLPVEISKLGTNVKIFTPKYSSINNEEFGLKYLDAIGKLRVRVAGQVFEAKIFKSLIPNTEVAVYFIDAPVFFGREKLYTDDFDEDTRFIFFQKAVIELIQRLQFMPDVIHCNDWQTGLIPLLIKDNYAWDRLFAKTKVFYTIHNIGYQGKFDPESIHKAEIHSKYFYPGGPLEYEGKVNFMKAALEFADVITTVSEKYAEEILTPDYGFGLHDTLNKRKNDLFGILNGIDNREWNPWFDKLIEKRYSLKTFDGKKANKEALQKAMNLPVNPDIPIISLISRMAYQKGFDIISETLPHLAYLDVQWVILGSGEEQYEQFFNDFVMSNPGKASVYIGYNNKLAHLIEAGSDMFLMPSRYEPCGLNQMYSLKYGTVPIVRKTGGLADTVFDWDELSSKGYFNGNGFSFEDYNGYALSDAIQRAVARYYDKSAWKKIISNGMKMDFTWKSSAKKYLDLYLSFK